MKNCAWHKCDKPFAPYGGQKYCSRSCKLRADEWRRARGSPIVHEMLTCDPEEFEGRMRRARNDLKREIEACKSERK